MTNEMLGGLSRSSSLWREIAPDVTLLQFTIVNACLVGNNAGWVLMDTGPVNSHEFILKVSEERFGKGSRPKAIVLTHGHFDHVGSVSKLAELWDVPVYAHPLEMPYITGKKAYPLPESTAGRGTAAEMSPVSLQEGINLGYRAVTLLQDGKVPGMTGWKWLHTPGHTDGHISFFREIDQTLIAGDAFTTIKQESLTSVLARSEHTEGPPAYFMTDWTAAGRSISLLRNLKPQLAIPSHGQPVRGDRLARHLEMLVLYFEGIAAPEHSRSSSIFFNSNPPR